MDNRSIHWSVTTSTLIGERVAGLVYWITALLVVGIVAIQVPKVLWLGIALLPFFGRAIVSFVRLRRVQVTLKAVRLVADEFWVAEQPYTFQFELDASEHLNVDRVSLICEWRARGWVVRLKRLPIQVRPVVANGQTSTFNVSGLAPVLTRGVTAGVLFWSVRVQVLGTDFSFPLQLQAARSVPPGSLIGVPK
nr:hypothetical protein [uncultured Rhodoferax sp.]